MPLRRIIGRLDLQKCIQYIELQLPGKARTVVTRKFIIEQMKKTGTYDECQNVAQREGVNPEQAVNALADHIASELLRKRGYNP